MPNPNFETFAPSDVILGPRTPEKIQMDRNEALNREGKAAYFAIRAMESSDPRAKEAHLNRMAVLEADNIEHQLQAGPESRVTGYAWNSRNEVQGIATRLKAVATGQEDQFARHNFRDETARAYYDLANPDDGEYISTQSQQGPQRYLANAKKKYNKWQKTPPPLRKPQEGLDTLERIKGFGLAALGEDDTKVALQAFQDSNSLSQPDIQNAIQKQIANMKARLGQDPSLVENIKVLEQALTVK